MATTNLNAGAPDHAPDSTALQLLERQLQRYSSGGDCAYERSLSQLYRRLFEQRLDQLDALRKAGL